MHRECSRKGEECRRQIVPFFLVLIQSESEQDSSYYYTMFNILQNAMIQTSDKHYYILLKIRWPVQFE